MSEVPSATCVVVAFHRPAALETLLAQLRHPSVQVVVVNVDDDPEVAAVAGDLAVPLMGNPGYAAAVNAGVRSAESEIVVFCNDDVEMSADTVLQLAEVVSSGTAEVALPRILDRTGRLEPTITALPSPVNLLREWFLLPDRRPTFLGERRLRVQKWRAPLVPEYIDAGAATVVATSTSLLRDIPLPEDYFLYWEESEWFWRLHAAGARVFYDPSLVVVHTGGRDDVRAAKSILLARNAVRCVRRTQGRGAGLVAWVVVMLWNLRLVTVDALRRLAGSAGAIERMPARAAGLRAAVAAWREL